MSAAGVIRCILARVPAILAICFSARVAAASPSYQFVNYSKDSGDLPYDAVRVLFEDSRRRVWIGTQKGLSSYDGERFTSYDRYHFGLDSDHVCCIEEDVRGNIWVGTDAGIVLYDPRSGGFRRVASDVIKTRVYVMERDPMGYIWIGIEGDGLYRAYDDEVSPVLQSGISDVYRIAFTGDSKVILASYCDDLYLYDGKLLKHFCGGAFLHDDVEGLCSRINASGTEVYVAAKNRGLCSVDYLTGAVSVIMDSPTIQRPVELFMSGDELLLSTTSGLVRYNIRTSSVERVLSDRGDKYSLKDDFIRYALLTSEGDLWVGTANAGVCVCDASGSMFARYYKTDGNETLDGCVVRGFTQTQDGKVWVATQRSGLLEFDPITGSLECLRSLPRIPDNITDIESDGSGLLYLGTQQGLVVFDPSTQSSKKYDRFGEKDTGIDNRIVSIYRSPSSGKIYVGTANGVSWLDRSRDEFVQIEELSDVAVEDFLETSDGILWMATYSKGAWRYDSESRNPLVRFGRQYENGPVYDMTSSLCLDNDGNIWVIGFSNGFFRYNGSSDSFTAFSRENTPQLPTDLYLSGLADQRGCLWLSTDAGMVQFSPETGAAATYTVRDGLLSDNFKKASLALTDGTFLFGNDDGFIRFDPSSAPLPQPRLSEKVPFFRTSSGIILIIIISTLLLSLITVQVVMSMMKKKAEKRQRMEEEERRRRLYKEKLDFFSGVIHEIKTPLTLIRTPLESLLNSGSPTSEQRADLSIISNSTAYLDRLVKELLDFIRTEEHGYVLEFQEIDIVERIGFLKFNFSDAAKNKSLRFTFRHDADELICAVDPSALDKILNNLFDNAVKYSSSYISVILETRDGNVVIRVLNDGPVIPVERRNSIFEAFVRYEDGRRPYTQSFGIGLAFARQLSALHGGSLELADREDSTEFILTLPLKRLVTQQELLAQDIGAEVSSSSAPLILSVEDNQDLLLYLKRKLKQYYRVVSCTSAEGAMELLGQYDFDLILTDIGLQGQSGVWLCGRVASSKEYSHIPVIVLSAISSVDTKIKCLESGATAYIEKPFSMDYLLACIRGILEKKHSIKVHAGTAGASVVAFTDRDEKFVMELDSIIAGNLSNPDFTNREMEEAMCMSRSSLNRRVNAVLQTTPNDYLKRKRLEEAARILTENPSSLVADVCFAVGFKSPSYFSKCFKSMYGVLPLDYRKMRK